MRPTAHTLTLGLLILSATLPEALVASGDDVKGAPLALETATDTFILDPATGRLTSLRSKGNPQIELLTGSATDPAFVLDYLGEDRQYRQLDSHQAAKISTTVSRTGSEQKVTCIFSQLSGLDVDVTLEVRATPRDRLSRWSIRVRNGAGIAIVSLQFPFVVAASNGGGTLLLPENFGHLRTGAALDQQPTDDPAHWRDMYFHYPGFMFAQFLAWYGTQGGVYVACEDTAANVKILKALKRGTGMRLGIAHVGDWPTNGERTLEYDVVLGSFQGDWYDAADLYRDWTLRQAWATPLLKRADVPAWLLDSPVYITVRPQGYMDHEAMAIEAFLPYEKCLPALDQIAQKVEAPLAVILMAWERGGPWVYPDCFPPAGGDDAMRRFGELVRARGWHTGSFCNGTRWVLSRSDGYDGRAFYEQNHGEQTVCRNCDGSLDRENWGWRDGYRCCMGQSETRRIATEFVSHLLSWGMESVQFFDQNCNASTLPCFATEHGHPPVPGKWMAAAMTDTIRGFQQAAREAGQAGVIQSTENPCNDYCLPLFQQCDVRICAPTSSGPADFVPIFHYLFHECIVIQGMMSVGPEPYSLPIRTALNGVLGEIPGAVLTGDGTLLNRDTVNWAPWSPKVGSNEDALEMLRVVTAMRRGSGRDFVVLGRMQHPANVSEVPSVEWKEKGRDHRVPAVVSAAWQAPDGRHAVVLANWTNELRSVTVSESRLGQSATVCVWARETSSSSANSASSSYSIMLPPLSCALLSQ